MLTILKHLHVWFALVSIAGFITRFFWQRHKPEMLQKRWVKITPHINDTALLASGLLMAWSIGYSLTELHWLTLKLTLVVVYIISGTLTLKLQIKAVYRFILLSLSLILFSSILILAVIKPTFS